MTIGERIKNLRISHGMTQSELADIAGVTDKAVSTWETETNNPRMGAIQRMSDFFHVSKGYLMGEDDDSVFSYLCDNLGPNTPAAQKLNELYAKLPGTVLTDNDERELVGIYRDLNALGQQTLMGTARGLSANPDMKKAGTSTGATA